MKKQKRLVTNYSTSKVDVNRLRQKVGGMLESSVPKNILGMLATLEDAGDSLIFYKRWKLVPVEKNNYEIIDLWINETVYSKIALFTSAMYMIYHMNKQVAHPCPKEQLIYGVDQEYYRCMENIRFYAKKSSTKDMDKLELYSARIQDSYYKLDEIKTRLSKIY
jgi:hypothetical protein